MTKEIKENHLFIDGVDTVSLAQKFGTPLYVYSVSEIREECRKIHAAFLDRYPHTRAAYAAKAFCTTAMLRIIEAEGLSLDVVSGGELYTAIQAGFTAEHIEFNGNNKSIEELTEAIDYGVGRIIVDGIQEIGLIRAICQETNQVAKIMLRITPEVSVQTHQFISTGQKDSKFGIPLDEEILFPLIAEVIEAPELDFYGLHFHVGSQLSDNQSHLSATDAALQLVQQIYERFSYWIKELNVGGGFGVRYTDTDVRQPYQFFLDPVMQKINDFYQQHDQERPTIVIEPGRSIVAEAGISLHTIGSIKTLPGIRTYASIDGGMTDNIRPGLYQASYTGILANRASEAATETITISGKACESTDILVKDLALPPVETGDIFATFATGAYGYSMASNYNNLQIPAVVFVEDGQAELAVKRQTYQQMIQNEVIPSFLAK
ncbi:diaminopimelate decarboxylase [Enterococcus sp. 8G7_MSG3316]|uniref:Diaminopimelate decarboxylase n=1 Tax=Candidatus Enterococcus testudinis TaxID=1834191 RepID=A0A242A922_9ENTE|nr:diaminopimelate decarboxylase [Enterococcus sp. 8G7_MSG3316]OTN77547.1 diaminopimelate decarboxylase [Enterococcus sp. 8G7_MSG3316]